MGIFIVNSQHSVKRLLVVDLIQTEWKWSEDEGMSSRYRWISFTDICLLLWRQKKKIPDIININLMIIQESIASQLQALCVDEVFKDKSLLKCTDWVAH